VDTKAVFGWRIVYLIKYKKLSISGRMNDTDIIKEIGLSNRKLTAKDVLNVIKEDGISICRRI